ncbi:hypothetical protein Tco_0394355 [Tanacetum coccineum]
MAGESGSNSVVDDLIELSGKTDPNEYLKLFVTQQIADQRGFIARMGPEVNIARNEVGQLNALIVGLEASEDVGEVWDTVMCLRDEQRKAEVKLADLQYWLTVAEEEIDIMDTQAIDDQAHLANYDSDNEIENDDLGYHSEEYFDDAHEDYENNHSNGNVVKRGITRISGKHRALFLSFLGDMVHEHIGLKILAWNKVGSEARDKLWDEITRYFDVDLTVRKLVKSAAAKMARSKSVYQHTMGRGGYALVKEKMIEKKEMNQMKNPLGTQLKEGIMETQAIDDQDHLVNYDNDNENDDLGYRSEEYFDEGDEEDENNHSNGNVVKRGITRLYKFRREYGKPDGIKLSVTFDALNRISGKHKALFSSFLGDMVREHIGLKILSWKKVDSEARDKLWDEITRYFNVDLTVRKLVMNRLGQHLRNFIRKLRQTYILNNQNTLSKLNEVPVKYNAILKAEEWVNFVKYTATEEYKVKSAAAKMARSKSVYQHTMGRGGYTLLKVKKEMKCGQDQRRNLEVVRAIDAPSLIRRAEQLLLDVRMRSSIQKSNGLATLEKEMETRTDGKQMLHNKELPKDCYKVSIDTSLVDAACIPDVGNNGFKTVKDAVGGFFAWPKDQVVFDPKATPPSTIQMNVENKTAPKLHTKAKNIFVLVDEMQGKLRRRVFRSP